MHNTQPSPTNIFPLALRACFSSNPRKHCRATPDKAIASELAAYLHALYARLRCCHAPSRLLAVQRSVVICRPFDPPACARNSFHLLAIAIFSSDLASCESAGRIAGQITWLALALADKHLGPWTFHRTIAQSRAVSLRAVKGLGNLHTLSAWSSHTCTIPFAGSSAKPTLAGHLSHYSCW